MAGEYKTRAEAYLAQMREDVPLFDKLQEAAVAAIPSAPARVLELGMGTGETTSHLLKKFPDAWVVGLDSSAEMVFALRNEYDDVQLARMEDPLPDGPWNLVISVLSIHHLTDENKHTLFRRVREQAKALVIGDIVKTDGDQVSKIIPGTDHIDTAEQLAEWCGGEIAWTEGDLAVVRATY